MDKEDEEIITSIRDEQDPTEIERRLMLFKSSIYYLELARKTLAAIDDRVNLEDLDDLLYEAKGALRFYELAASPE